VASPIRQPLLVDLSDLEAAPFDSNAWATQVYAGLYGTHGTKISWQDYVDGCNECLNATITKGEGPAFMFGITPSTRRRVEDYAEGQGFTTALAVDVDEGMPDLAPFRAVLAGLRKAGITYHAQWRRAANTYKTHLVLPYATPYPIRDVDSVRDANLDLTRRLLGPDVTFDPAVAKVAGVLFTMTKRPGVPEVPEQEWFITERAFDMSRHFPVWRQGATKQRRKVAKDEATEQTKLFLGHVVVNEWLESKNAWDINCPVEHDDDYAGKTYLYPSGHISCMAGKCQGKPMAWFLEHLPQETQREAQAESHTRLKAELAANLTTTVSIAEAHEQIYAALESTRPVEAHATVVQVSTGAGKTHAVSKYLDQYTTPFEDERAGLSAVMAVPTNALLREVDQRLQTPHQVRMGVLAVLNDDGTPACKKHAIAKPLQASGGNVHRLLCGHCEYKDDCVARASSTTGDGSLVLTNHALMVQSSKELLDAGRHPLLVWDESPPWVQTSQVLVQDLDWLLGEFDREAVPIRAVGAEWLEALSNVTLFSPKYRAAVRPVLEALRWAKQSHRGVHTAQALLQSWIKLPLHQMLLSRAMEASDFEPTGDAWADFCTSYTRAYRLNLVEMGFDAMRPETQRRVLRAERLMTSLGVMAGHDAVLVIDEYTISMASLTQAGQLFRTNGGVVLDATANTAELRALRPDLSLTQCRVEDRGQTERYLHDVVGLDRKSMKHRPGRLLDCVRHAQGIVRRWGRREGLTPKVAVFGYKSSHDELVKAWPDAEIAWFGNTRGYDRFYQEGFDVFVTLGDPVSNLGVLALQWRVLTGQDPEPGDAAWQRYVAASAESELAQAHGRARSPQAKLGAGGRLHLHYGRRVPAGWDLESTQIDALSFAEGRLILPD
jgi:hypothetical protein